MSTHPISQQYQTDSIRQLAALLSERMPPDQVAPEEWAALIKLAMFHNVAFMLLWNVKRAAPELVTDQEWEIVLQAVRVCAVRHIWFEESQQTIQRAFDAAGVRAIWLKGIALARSAYPQPSLRSMSDLDVLVSFEQRAEALEIARRLGYDFYAVPHQRGERIPDWEADHHYRLMLTQTPGTQLEIHYRIIDDGAGAAPKPAELWMLDQVDTSIDALPMLKAEACLLHLCAHALIHHGEEHSLLSYFLDMHLLITTQTIDWALVVEQAAALRWTYAVEHALKIVSSLFDSPIPAQVFAQLAACRPADENIARVIGLQGDGANFETVLGVLRGAPLREKWVRIRNYAIPSRSYLRDIYHLSPNTPIWRYYVRRWIEQGGKILAWSRQRLNHSQIR